jgi:hypothetical protein
MYSSGKGVPKDPALSLAFYRKACDDGDAAACANVGAMYELGNGVEKSKALAQRFYQRACDGGYEYTCGAVPPLQPK